MSYKYNEPTDITKEKFSQIIAEGIIVSMCQAIIDAVHYISDYDWLLAEFRKLLNHTNAEVRGVTVSCIGHLARLNKNADKDQLLQILQPLLSDDEIAGRVEDAMDDINMFLK